MAQNPAVESFRDWLASEYGRDGAYDRVELREGAEAVASDLTVRLHVGARSYYEVRVDETKREVQVGFGTENRMVNEEIEQMVLDNGGDLDELLGDELCDLGEQPMHMEHFFERPSFRFIVRLRLDDAEMGELNDEPFRKRVRAVLKSCRILFQECVDEA